MAINYLENLKPDTPTANTYADVLTEAEQMNPGANFIK